jgi:DNA-binding response OmpR family regulator
MLSGIDGLDFLRSVRDRDLKTPIIKLRTRTDLQDMLSGFAASVDIYLSKLFYIEEPIGRLKNLIKKIHGLTRSAIKEVDFWHRLMLDVCSFIYRDLMAAIC